ncbi:hypothetical protein SAMN04489747_2101 [Auraticoccus monumenti]|uniref:Uncharacterized protein n=1 Tax=Auraticoccus monumenti TaxID=675864 RepID=A0A1G6YTW3_9ACTN|nr:hypothetical protein SAMN04489747_2101 [Auraticoccus monumenti]
MLAGLVALVLVAVLALVGYVALRPLKPADYSLANNEVGYLGQQIDFVGQSVAKATTDLGSGDQAVIEASAQAVRDQVGVAADQAAALSDLRAVDDPEVATQVGAVQQGVTDMQTYLRGFADAMLPTAETIAACDTWAEDEDTAVDSGATRAEVEAAAEPCRQMAGALQQQGGGAWSQLAGAQLARVDGVLAVFELVESDPDDFEAHYAAEAAAREDYQAAVGEADAALAQELEAVGSAVTDPLNSLGRYTQERAGG